MSSVTFLMLLCVSRRSSIGTLFARELAATDGTLFGGDCGVCSGEVLTESRFDWLAVTDSAGAVPTGVSPEAPAACAFVASVPARSWPRGAFVPRSWPMDG